MRRSGGEELLRRLADHSPHTERHSRRVGNLAARLGYVLPDVAEPVIVSLGFSGALHDVGKAHPSTLGLVNSAKSLGKEDVERLRGVHTREGAKMIASLIPSRAGYEDLLGTAAYVALHHHDDPQTLPEKVDASSMRPRIAGLVNVIDRFEALQTTDRPYIATPRAGSPEEAVSMIAEEVEIQPFFGSAPATLMDALVSIAEQPL